MHNKGEKRNKGLKGRKHKIDVICKCAVYMKKI
jgi:hypothetical protein